MKKNDRIEEKETFLRLLNREINRTHDLWSQDPYSLRTYAWGYRYIDDAHIALGSNHDKSFYYADVVIKLAIAFGYKWYISTMKNSEGEITATVNVSLH